MSSCDTYKSCEACSSSGSCHWCGDALNGAYYYEYNFFECVWSTPCEQLEKCFRTEPEFLEYGSRTVYFRLGMALFIFWVCIFIPFYMFIVKPLSNQATKANSDSEEGKLEEADNEDDILDDENSLEDPLIDEINLNSDISSNISTQSRYHKFCSYLFATVSLLLALIVIITVYFAPTAPSFSVCTSEMEWGSIIKSFTNFDYAVQGKYYFQASIYNPNRVKMELVDCFGEFKYKGTTIGTFTVNDDPDGPGKKGSKVSGKHMVAPAGSVVDVLFVISFDIPVSIGLEIAELYETTGDVSVEVKTSVVAGIDFYHVIKENVSFRLPRRVFHIANVQDELCKCKTEKNPNQFKSIGI